MIEIPEACVLARQIEEKLAGKRVKSILANHSPHKFAWYHDDPANYDDLLRDKQLQSATARGGLVEVFLEDTRIVLGEGVAVRFIPADQKRPAKHQLLVEFTDGSAIVATVQMYGGMWCFKEGEFDNPYYQIACSKPSPLGEEFDLAYFAGLLDEQGRKKSAKAFLATEQRIPGLGNGVLQDILYQANIHPRRSMLSLTDQELETLFLAIKATLRQMADQGGRDTEKDLFGQPGGYRTILSKNTVNTPCPRCGELVRKEAYMGGSIYYCSGCQSRS